VTSLKTAAKDDKLLDERKLHGRCFVKNICPKIMAESRFLGSKRPPVKRVEWLWGRGGEFAESKNVQQSPNKMFVPSIRPSPPLAVSFLLKEIV